MTSFDFFQLVRLLRREASKPVKFKQAIDFHFPATDVSDLAEGSEKIMITVCFLSLCGAQGVLPDPLKRIVLERACKKDCALQDFLDIFHHRIITLFYDIWESRHFFVGYERAEPSPILRWLQSFLGETHLLQQRHAPYQELFFYYSGFFAARHRSVSEFIAMVEDYFSWPLSMTSVGEWVSVEPGVNYLGARVFHPAHHCRVVWGPVSYDFFLQCLPGGKALKTLMDMMELYWGSDVLFDVVVTIQRQFIPPQKLGEIRLNWNAWLMSTMDERLGIAVFQALTSV